MYSQFVQTQSVIPKAYHCRTLEGNWYEDRCTSKYDNDHIKKFSLRNPLEWQFDTTNKKIGEFHLKDKKLCSHFAEGSDNYINFQSKKNNMFVTTYKNSYDEKYKESFYQIKPFKNYYKGKESDLESYRSNWTKREQFFDTTYKDDLLKTFMMKKK